MSSELEIVFAVIGTGVAVVMLNMIQISGLRRDLRSDMAELRSEMAGGYAATWPSCAENWDCSVSALPGWRAFSTSSGLACNCRGLMPMRRIDRSYRKHVQVEVHLR